ncbi:MAG: hypothetical protein JRI63_01875 [Deltaproteobacteria bacterium]|nr:hypothetical protein [Deltaproteobacteria bacterium]MBW2012457.1 hypothetical protein [Deltaproteobacteria bacterium]
MKYRMDPHLPQMNLKKKEAGRPTPVFEEAPAKPERVFNRWHSTLFRGLKTSENAAGDRKMPFMGGHYLIFEYSTSKIRKNHKPDAQKEDLKRLW